LKLVAGSFLTRFLPLSFSFLTLGFSSFQPTVLPVFSLPFPPTEARASLISLLIFLMHLPPSLRIHPPFRVLGQFLPSFPSFYDHSTRAADGSLARGCTISGPNEFIQSSITFSVLFLFSNALTELGHQHVYSRLQPPAGLPDKPHTPPHPILRGCRIFFFPRPIPLPVVRANQPALQFFSVPRSSPAGAKLMCLFQYFPDQTLSDVSRHSDSTPCRSFLHDSPT